MATGARAGPGKAEVARIPSIRHYEGGNSGRIVTRTRSPSSGGLQYLLRETHADVNASVELKTSRHASGSASIEAPPSELLLLGGAEELVRRTVGKRPSLDVDQMAAEPND
ncbi:hypothetical protein EYF80_024273 [Liparis tanakae]|uniref:Uncharacterized protein n=1 Tax=Liparis tanakae TaxID=230148 RepID=A0A4Z2HKL2_9TELE|nr:hypothetical protein EYF80_024273 [Liparis tanakae]